ncbi:MAG TPA: pyridoxal phosphate-dependent aminotransferase [Verrucomicrobiae bacterium]|nr:pyridoxal phosphate-dependent aminotransferase [Verrucomicrobiae bacterium]
MKLAARLENLEPSATIAVKAEADRLKEKGIDVIDFGPGEPDFDTPANVKEAGRQAIDANLSHYLPTLGYRPLREAIASSYRTRYGSDYSESEILVGCGAKNVLYEAMMAIVSRGDEVIIPAPYWVSFPEQVRLADGVPVILPSGEKDGFIPKASAADAVCTDRTRAIVLCSPSNPTGAVIPQEEIDRFVALALRRDLFLVFDECYEHFLYDGRRHATPALSDRRVRDRLLLVSSVSKSYAMTGWRVGYALGPKELISAMAAIQSHDTTHTAGCAMAAAAAGIAGPQDSIARMLAEYTARRSAIVDGLNAVRGMVCPMPGGAFYAFPRVTGLYGKLGVNDDAAVATFLLREAKVATVPGSAFGAAGYLRLSYALSLDRIREGVDRIRKCVGRE